MPGACSCKTVDWKRFANYRDYRFCSFCPDFSSKHGYSRSSCCDGKWWDHRIGPVGLNIVALAAQKYNVPFVVVAAIHKLCPLYPDNPEVSVNDMRSPHELLEFGKFSDFEDFESGKSAPLVHAVNPIFDYVAPELATLLITDVGGYTLTNMHLLIADHYSADDLVLQLKSVS